MRRLIRLTVETGLACALCAVIVLALFLGSPDTNLQVVLCVNFILDCLSELTLISACQYYHA